jgi:hypothetical protein
MTPSDRIITRLPLTELWDVQGPIAAVRHRDLVPDDIRELLSVGPVQFMVADIGSKPVWVNHDSRFDFWKEEVLPHLARSETVIRPEEYPQSYCYIASEWRTYERGIVIVLQRFH